MLSEILPTAPSQIVDLGCSTGLSTFALQNSYPAAQITGVDLSPHFLTVAQYVCAHPTTGYGHLASHSAGNPSIDEREGDKREGDKRECDPIRWVHAVAEDTGLSENSADLASACLVFHELPTAAAQNVIAEAYRLVRPGGHLAQSLF